MPNPMMKCGHAANAQDENGNPCCVICVGIDPGAEIIDNSSPSLEDRKSKCTYCDNTRDSSADLPFFKHQPNKDVDSHYCGCKGWN